MNYDFNIMDNMNFNNNLDLFNSYEGYLKGNMFRNLYNPYRNYKVPKIMINSSEEELLMNISEYSFVITDLNLYLDTHPEDRNALNLLNNYVNTCNELVKKYEKEYGPLTMYGTRDKIPDSWVLKKWPWEV